MKMNKNLLKSICYVSIGSISMLVLAAICRLVGKDIFGLSVTVILLVLVLWWYLSEEE